MEEKKLSGERVHGDKFVFLGWTIPSTDPQNEGRAIDPCASLSPILTKRVDL